MGDLISLIYVYGNYSEDKIVDPERYGYIDVVYDAYSMVLKDIPDGKTVNFSVKVFLPDGVKELVLGSDSDVLHMFHKYENEDQPIQCFVFGVEVSKEFSINYTVNGYHKSLMQRSSQTLVENSSFNNKKNVSRKTLCKKNVSRKTLCKKTVTKKTLCKKTISTPIVQRFAITGRLCAKERELIPGTSSSMENTHDQFVDKQVGDETVGDETVRDETVRDEAIGDEEMGDDDSMDSEWGKDSNEVGDDDSTNSEKDLEIDEDMGGVADSDGKLSDYKSDDSPDEIDCWVERNIDQTEKGKMRVGLIFADVHAFRAALKDYVVNAAIIVDPSVRQVIASACDQTGVWDNPTGNTIFEIRHGEQVEVSTAHEFDSNGVAISEKSLSDCKSNDHILSYTGVSCLYTWRWREQKPCARSPRYWHPLRHAALGAIEYASARDRRLFPGSNSEGQPIHGDHMQSSSMSLPPKRQKTETAEGHNDIVLKTCTINLPSEAVRPYLCTGFDIYLVWEPCTMCAMALVHQRIRRIFYAFPNPNAGALGSVYGLQGEKSLNHHYAVFKVLLPEEILYKR
ncbi:hypothetical protein NE237_000734 [Protea cynaroides]|uniref:CMP/dCMP-type deaminase domain-containing protein n=1 Tax=Protea cynaroides TaxID=273540 RepID=A0A9Q0QXG9_9MAGN|nr:hypothetical protein NE237_000734 [Protea cynaroides]